MMGSAKCVESNCGAKLCLSLPSPPSLRRLETLIIRPSCLGTVERPKCPTTGSRQKNCRPLHGTLAIGFSKVSLDGPCQRHPSADGQSLPIGRTTCWTDGVQPRGVANGKSPMAQTARLHGIFRAAHPLHLPASPSPAKCEVRANPEVDSLPLLLVLLTHDTYRPLRLVFGAGGVDGNSFAGLPPHRPPDASTAIESLSATLGLDTLSRRSWRTVILGRTTQRGKANWLRRGWLGATSRADHSAPPEASVRRDMLAPALIHPFPSKLTSILALLLIHRGWSHTLQSPAMLQTGGSLPAPPCKPGLLQVNCCTEQRQCHQRGSPSTRGRRA
jgi:hypothetical protein